MNLFRPKKPKKTGIKRQPPQVQYPEIVYKDIRLDKNSYEKLSDWARSQRVSERKALARLIHHGVIYFAKLKLRSDDEDLMVAQAASDMPTGHQNRQTQGN